jgi:hypothetical protein
MQAHRRTRKGGEEKCCCCSYTFILELEHEPQMTKLCREYKDGFPLTCLKRRYEDWARAHRRTRKGGEEKCSNLIAEFAESFAPQISANFSV